MNGKKGKAIQEEKNAPSLSESGKKVKSAPLYFPLLTVVEKSFVVNFWKLLPLPPFFFTRTVNSLDENAHIASIFRLLYCSNRHFLVLNARCSRTQRAHCIQSRLYCATAFSVREKSKEKHVGDVLSREIVAKREKRAGIRLFFFLGERSSEAK